MDSILDVIERYSNAKSLLAKLFESTGGPSDSDIRVVDRELENALSDLKFLKLTSNADLAKRIEFLLSEVVELSSESSLVRDFCDCINNDFATYSSNKLLHSATSIETLEASNSEIMELCYVSKASSNFRLEDVAAIKNEAQIYNSNHDITGFLTYDEKTNRFFQILEGSRESLQELLTKIINDHRHYDLDVRFQCPIDNRIFSEWAMISTTTSRIRSELEHGEDFETWIRKLLAPNAQPTKSRGQYWLVKNISPLLI